MSSQYACVGRSITRASSYATSLQYLCRERERECRARETEKRLISTAQFMYVGQLLIVARASRRKLQNKKAWLPAETPKRSASARARIHSARARMLERHVQLKLALYTAGSAIALTGAVRTLVLPHAVTAGASLYIEQEYPIAGKPE